MIHKLFSTLALASLALSAAVPQGSRPCESSEFTMTVEVNGEERSLNAIDSGTKGVLVLVAEPLPEYPGTPVIRYGRKKHAQLVLNLEGHNDPLSKHHGCFDMFVGDIGDSYGYYTPVIAQKNLDYKGFMIYNKTIDNERTAALQEWFICKNTINGKTHQMLGWGVSNINGSSPYGCQPTFVKQSFNLDCSES